MKGKQPTEPTESGQRLIDAFRDAFGHEGKVARFAAIVEAAEADLATVGGDNGARELVIAGRVAAARCGISPTTEAHRKNLGAHVARLRLLIGRGAAQADAAHDGDAGNTPPDLTPQQCDDCGAPEGSFHRAQCPSDICATCHGRVTSGAADVSDRAQIVKSAEYRGLEPVLAVVDGDCTCVTPSREAIYCISRPCVRCGRKNPAPFTVTDQDWAFAVPTRLRREVMCRRCFDFLRSLRDV